MTESECYGGAGSRGTSQVPSTARLLIGKCEPRRAHLSGTLPPCILDVHRCTSLTLGPRQGGFEGHRSTSAGANSPLPPSFSLLCACLSLCFYLFGLSAKGLTLCPLPKDPLMTPAALCTRVWRSYPATSTKMPRHPDTASPKSPRDGLN
ncbi:hypothetical protein GQ53DRAFT_243912 [Thozetella sp. PMI_491]|nr:hypothetical protein GQ53DRAFT_243912 [Thozetella sp. PMI_491]